MPVKSLSLLAIHHIDGNPRNNTPANLRLVDVKTGLNATRAQIKDNMKSMLAAPNESMAE